MDLNRKHMIPTTETSRHASRRGFTFGRGLAAACLLALAGGTASAQTVVSPGTLVGDSSTQLSGAGNGAGITNPNGSATQFLATTFSTSGDGSTVSGNSAVPVTTLANYSYLDASSLTYRNNSGTEGSAFLFNLNVTSAANNSLVFTYNFATAEAVDGTGNPDFAFFSLTPVDANGNATGNTTFGLLGSAGDGAGSFSAINDPLGQSPFSYTEGYKNGVRYGLANGRYVLALGVADANSFDTQSGLYVGSVTQVPEPATTALLLVGGLGAVLVWRRRANA